MIAQHSRYEDYMQAVHVSSKKNIMWIFLRESCPKTPRWGRFVSITGDSPKRITTFGYLPVIHNPITAYKTVQECLRLAQEATHEFEQKYTITTFDLEFA